jgi:hypothetical protein
MNTPTPITEAQYQLAHEIRQSSYQQKAAQLIADSEARAIATQLEVVVILTRRWLNVEKERDQLRAEVERWQTVAAEMSAQREHNANVAAETVALANWNGALERAIKAEAELAAERERVRVLREALENLRDEQNGAPLCIREEQWTQAMDGAEAAIAATEDAK